MNAFQDYIAANPSATHEEVWQAALRHAAMLVKQYAKDHAVKFKHSQDAKARSWDILSGNGYIIDELESWADASR